MACPSLLLGKLCLLSSSSTKKLQKIPSKYKLLDRFRPVLATHKTQFRRRQILLFHGVSLVSFEALNLESKSLPEIAEEKNLTEQKDSDEGGVFGEIKSFFDPNEKTKSGKVLPKAYLKSAREVVKTLRESLKENSNDIAKFRRSADAAKESIREYFSDWRGKQSIVSEESYIALEKAIRSLANFYAKAGPSAALPDEIKSGILDDLDRAESFL